MGQARDPLDPKGLIRESFRIEGISPGECRSILLDSALGLPIDLDSETSRMQLADRYGAKHPDHPMTLVLREGGTTGAPGDTARPRRRGGWRARREGGTG